MDPVVRTPILKRFRLSPLPLVPPAGQGVWQPGGSGRRRHAGLAPDGLGRGALKRVSTAGLPLGLRKSYRKGWELG